MSDPSTRPMLLIVICALVGCFLAVASFHEQISAPRLAIELMLTAPMVIWLLGRRLPPGTESK